MNFLHTAFISLRGGTVLTDPGRRWRWSQESSDPRAGVCQTPSPQAYHSEACAPQEWGRRR